MSAMPPNGRSSAKSSGGFPKTPSTIPDHSMLPKRSARGTLLGRRAAGCAMSSPLAAGERFFTVCSPPVERSSNQPMPSSLTADSSSPVSRHDLELHIATAQARVINPLAGIFGPDSVTWRINREAALFLGAGRAAFLQLAHPWVATALDQHSSLLAKPIARFHNTFRTVFTMIFGSAPQAFRAARSLYQLHTTITGQLPSPVAAYQKGSHYQALHVPALIWVYATLIDSAVIAHQAVLPALDATSLAAYYAESKILAGLFGIPPDALPADWP